MADPINDLQQANDSDVLRSINRTLAQIARNTSQSNVRDVQYEQSTYFRNQYSTGNFNTRNNYFDNGTGSKRRSRRGSSFGSATNDIFEDFLDGVAKQMEETLQTEKFKKTLDKKLDDFAHSIGSDLDHLSSDFGQALTKTITQNTKIGRYFDAAFKNFANASQDVLNNVTEESLKQATEILRKSTPADLRRRQANIRYMQKNGMDLSKMEEVSQSEYNTRVEELRRSGLNPRDKEFQDAIHKLNVTRDTDENGNLNPSDWAYGNTKLFGLGSDFLNNLRNLHTGDNLEDAKKAAQQEAQTVIDKNQKESEQISKASSKIDTMTVNAQTVNIVKSLESETPEIKKPSEENVADIAKSAAESATEGMKKATGTALANISKKSLPAESMGSKLAGEAMGSANALLGSIGALGQAFIGLLGPLLLLEVASTALTLIVNKAAKAFAPLTESWKDWVASYQKNKNRFFETQKAQIKTQYERIRADVDTYVRAPFEIMEKAAQEWYSAWDSNLRTINATQGYSKEDLQDLLAHFAQRLRDEGLSSYVSATDITNNLANVLKSGLSGTVAEEFAYQATKLNAAVPTQDFFQYASSYASVAANLLEGGASQSEAISAANKQLEQFASNVLYASRQLSGGFSTGLQDASKIFTDSANIARAAHITDTSQISGVLTATASAVGAVAPDLASSIVDAIYQAATGGNSDANVALRSLANTGASNTAFLQEFAKNPQSVITTMFSNLSNMQKVNADNYMEVAESLASTFGISMDSLARVDFGSLANTISNMEVNTRSLSENVKLLQSGQTTTTTEQLKMQEINKMIVDEGLSYVLDNETARTIQQHMWDQEIANQIQETTYSVELAENTTRLFEGIRETIHNILSFINPLAWIQGIANTITAANEFSAEKESIKQMLELTKVGKGNAHQLKQLTTYQAKNLDKQQDLLEMLGSNSPMTAANAAARRISMLSTSPWSMASVNRSVNHSISSSKIASPDSQYGWAYVGKSVANAVQSVIPHINYTTYGSGEQESPIRTTVDQMRSFLSSMMDKFDNTTSRYVATYTGGGTTTDANGRIIHTVGKRSVAENVRNTESYDDWFNRVATESNLRTRYGIDNLDESLNKFGLTQDDLKKEYERQQTKAGQEYNAQREAQEDLFWQEALNFTETDFPQFQDDFQYWSQKLETAITNFNADWHNNWLVGEKGWPLWTSEKGLWQDWVNGNGANTWNNYLKHWLDKNVSFSTYTKDINGRGINFNQLWSKVSGAQANKTGDSVMYLAEMLTKNNVNMNDPTVQTNVLLSQILIVLQAIMQTENNSGGKNLQTTLSALGLGLTNTST